MPFCPNQDCGRVTPWEIRRGMLKCPKCRREWSPRLPLHVSESEWRPVVEYKLKNCSTDFTAQELGWHRQRVLRAFEWIRKAMLLEEEGRRFTDRVEIGWTEFKVGSNRRKGSHMQKVRVFGILGEETLSIEIQQAISPKFVIGVLKEKVEEESQVNFGPGSWNSLAIETLTAEGYSIVHAPDLLPDSLSNVFDRLRKVIHKSNPPFAKLPLHIGEFVWVYNHRLMPKGEKKKKVDLILQALRDIKPGVRVHRLGKAKSA